MDTKKIFQTVFKSLTYISFFYCLMSVETATAGGKEPTKISAEYKCTDKCSMCVTFDGKKTVCSEKYADDSEEFLKAKKLSRFVNEGLITPPVILKNNFNIDSFARQFYKCDLMVKKVELIQEATKNLCVQKVVKTEKTVLVPRTPAQVKKKSKD